MAMNEQAIQSLLGNRRLLIMGVIALKVTMTEVF